MTKYHYFFSSTWQDRWGNPKFGSTEATAAIPISDMRILSEIAAGIKRELGNIVPEGNSIIVLSLYLFQKEAQ